MKYNLISFVPFVLLWNFEYLFLINIFSLSPPNLLSTTFQRQWEWARKKQKALRSDSNRFELTSVNWLEITLTSAALNSSNLIWHRHYWSCSFRQSQRIARKRAYLHNCKRKLKLKKPNMSWKLSRNETKFRISWWPLIISWEIIQILVRYQHRFVRAIQLTRIPRSQAAADHQVDLWMAIIPPHCLVQRTFPTFSHPITAVIYIIA